MSKIKNLNGKVGEFAKSCYKNNSISELDNALACTTVVINDCINWDITLIEYSDAVYAALEDLIGANK